MSLEFQMDFEGRLANADKIITGGNSGLLDGFVLGTWGVLSAIRKLCITNLWAGFKEEDALPWVA